MQLVLDAFNVLHVTGVLPPELAGIDLDGLADLIEVTRFGRGETWIVCDGMRPRGGPARRERVWFSWAGGGVKADDVIVGLVQRSSSPRRMTVVSTDRNVTKIVRRRGADTMTSEEFLERLAADWRNARPERRFGPRAASGATTPSPKRPPLRATVPLAAPEVRAWLAAFGIAPDIADLESEIAVKADRPQAVAPRSPVPTAPSAPAPDPAPDWDDPLSFAGIDLARLLQGTPPPRNEPRATRRARRDRRG
ncbi:MAG: NYN domain-containing protein [Phycisphaerae bacterium]|nr:NYN domain-containing protein [Phycisphaerae bacterium]